MIGTLPICSPRPPLPKSATLTEEEAAIIIQSFFRGYLVRKEEKAQLFRRWQRGLWEERMAANKIKQFVRKMSEMRRPKMDKLERKPGKQTLMRKGILEDDSDGSLEEEVREEEEEEKDTGCKEPATGEKDPVGTPSSPQQLSPERQQ